MSIGIDSRLDSTNEIWDISLEGELDISSADKLKEKLHNLLEENMIDIKINLKDLDYIDSTGLGVMIGVLKKLKLNDKQIFISNPKNNVKKIFTITGMDKIFKMEG